MPKSDSDRTHGDGVQNRLKNYTIHEARALSRVLIPHKDNNDMEKVLTWVLLTVWGVITVGIAFGYADATKVYTTLTGLVWLWVGRVWGVESARSR